jgi:CelD/BcsL family acetyltransferase involved in cellulose biosynthesis
MYVERVASLEALATLATEWSELDARLSPRTPFTGLLWNQLWWRHYAAERLLVHDELFLHVVRDQHRRLHAIAPMMLTRRPSLGPFGVRALQCFGTDVNITEIRGLVCEAQDQGTALKALRKHFDGGADRWDWIDWGGVREDGTGRQGLLGCEATGWDRQTPNYYLALPSSWEELRQQLPRNIKESLRKCYNSLRRSGHSHELRVAESSADAPAALETFFRLHRERASSTAGMRHSDVFAKSRERDFFRDYVQQMADRRQLRLFQLRIAGQVVATRIGFLLGDELYLYYSGYDMRWAQHSVMTTLLAETIKWAIGQGLRIVNLSTGNDVSKLRWRPRSVVFRSAVQVAPRWQARLAFNAYHHVLRTREGASPAGRLLALAQR